MSKLLRLLGILSRSTAYSMSLPSADHVSALLNTAFWTSLQQEEGRLAAVALWLQQHVPTREGAPVNFRIYICIDSLQPLTRC